MTEIKSNISISLDGFVAGANQGTEHPLGEGGERLHEWVIRTAGWRAHHGMTGGEESADSEVTDEVTQNVGAHIMGRNMFSPGRGAWDETWRGWWGEEPPFHAPVFVLTHHPREPLTMAGGTTFTFVTDGIHAALDAARAAAGPDRDVAIAGGAQTIRQYLAAGLLDELYLHIVPVLLGRGERLLTEEAGDPVLEPVKVVASPSVTHVKYRVRRVHG
ncbi:dihydrofolate reductase family protein [Streptomyces sp. 6N223]|uniref:dihydrofolate reductase family protein n=1 Tax=Streptomyces sp. 6N223 TaxID=3457412 RepID=UPI003FCF9631